jgi:hypothetical protein
MESGSSSYSKIFFDNLQHVTCGTPTRKQEIHNRSVCSFYFLKKFYSTRKTKYINNNQSVRLGGNMLGWSCWAHPQTQQSSASRRTEQGEWAPNSQLHYVIDIFMPGKNGACQGGI